MVAALLNISIPLELGQLINAVSHMEPGQPLQHYLMQLTPSAAVLIALYVAQVGVDLDFPLPFLVLSSQTPFHRKGLETLVSCRVPLEYVSQAVVTCSRIHSPGQPQNHWWLDMRCWLSDVHAVTASRNR